jgi:hypothetical protein
MTVFRRFLLSIMLAGATALAVSIPAFADSPHFLEASASIADDGSLVCTFKEAGLGNTVETEQITCKATATAVYACVNLGQNHPKARNKSSVTADVSRTQSFPVDNGQTTGSVTVAPPPAGPFQPDCSPPMSVVLVSITYADITLVGLQGDSVSLGTLTRVFFPEFV